MFLTTGACVLGKLLTSRGRLPKEGPFTTEGPTSATSSEFVALLTPSSILEYVRVLDRELMAFIAMGALRVPGTHSNATQDVNARSDGLKVHWIDACLVAAQMV